MNRVTLLCATALALFAAGPARAETAAPAAVPTAAAAGPALTLEECVARALDKNFDLEIQRLSTQNARENVIVADAAFDPTLSLSTGKAFSQSAALGAATPGAQSQGETTRLGVSQKVVTGATLSASGNLDRSRSGGGGPILNPAYNGDLSLAVSQPLLKGAGLEINHAAQAQARLGVTVANATLKSSVLTVVRNVESAYFNLAFAREQLGVRRFSLEVEEKLLSENQIRRETGVVTDLEVLQAEVGVANARQTVLLAEQTVHNSEDALLQLISRFEFDQPLGTVRLPDDAVPEISLASSYALARASLPDYLAAQAILKQLEISARTAKDSLQPSLSLDSAVGLNSRESSYADSASQLSSGHGYSWQVDLTLSFPWGFRAENARYRQAVSSLNSQQTHLLQIDQNLLVQVRSAVRDVQTSQQSVTIAALSSRLSQRQYDLEKARYDAGVSTFRLVQDAQAALDLARISELQANVNLRQALAELARLEASSLARYKIKLQE